MEEFGQSLKDMAGTVGSMSIKGFDRAKQFSQEKMGSAVRTELDQVKLIICINEIFIFPGNIFGEFLEFSAGEF